MLIFGFVYFKATYEVVHEPLKFVDLGSVLQLSVGNVTEVGGDIGLIFELCEPLQVFVIDFEIGIYNFLEKHLVVLHKGVESGLCVKGYLI